MLNIKACTSHISGTWELLVCKYARKSMIISENILTSKNWKGRLKLCLRTISLKSWRKSCPILLPLYDDNLNKTVKLLLQMQLFLLIINFTPQQFNCQYATTIYCSCYITNLTVNNNQSFCRKLYNLKLIFY